MTRNLTADLCIIGAGSGGLSVAAGAAQLGADCILVERAKMGGDCLNTGCVPSKALLAAARGAVAGHKARRFGLTVGATPSGFAADFPPVADFSAVNDHVHDVIAGIAPHDSVERFESLGVRVIRAEARFISPREVMADDAVIRARRFVIATGSGAFVPPIPGLDTVPYLTNESLFDLRRLPEHLIVIGGGPIGLEMAQAHRRLGARVTVVEALSILGRDDPEAAAVVRQRLLGEGVTLLEGARVAAVEKASPAPVRERAPVADAEGAGIILRYEKDGETRQIEGSHLLVAVGRAAHVGGLGLDDAGIRHTAKGIAVDSRLRTSNRRVYAIGDVAGGLQFTHVAGYHAGIVIRNALFRLPARADHRAVPWVTYTDPELAQVGLVEDEARKTHDGVGVLCVPFSEIDRARAERETDGFLKVITGRRGRVLGATLVGAHAGELILPWCLAVQGKIGLADLAGTIIPYPTLSEITRRAAGSHYASRLFSDRTRRIVRFLSRFG